MRKKKGQVEQEESAEIAEKVASLLTKGFLAWQMNSGESKTLKEYSDWLDIPITQLHQYKSGKRVPTNKHVHKIGRRLPLIYAIIDVLPSDDELRFLIQNWAFLSPSAKKSIMTLAQDEIDIHHKGLGTPNESISDQSIDNLILAYLVDTVINSPDPKDIAIHITPAILDSIKAGTYKKVGGAFQDSRIGRESHPMILLNRLGFNDDIISYVVDTIKSSQPESFSIFLRPDNVEPLKEHKANSDLHPKSKK